MLLFNYKGKQKEKERNNMRKICVWIGRSTDNNNNIISKIAEDFPCFVSIENLSDNINLEITIECRQEDTGAIEKRLAWLV